MALPTNTLMGKGFRGRNGAQRSPSQHGRGFRMRSTFASWAFPLARMTPGAQPCVSECHSMANQIALDPGPFCSSLLYKISNTMVCFPLVPLCFFMVYPLSLGPALSTLLVVDWRLSHLAPSPLEAVNPRQPIPSRPTLTSHALLTSPSSPRVCPMPDGPDLRPARKVSPSSLRAYSPM